MEDVATTLAVVGERVARYELQWSWENIDPMVKAKFITRVGERLPLLDPEAAWTDMTLKGRRELAWHLSRTPEQLRSAWEEDVRRLKDESDDATNAAFRVLAKLAVRT